MENELKFLGHNTKYWLELQERADKLQATNFIQEIADLRGKLSFVESRLEEINKVLSK